MDSVFGKWTKRLVSSSNVKQQDDAHSQLLKTWQSIQASFTSPSSSRNAALLDDRLQTIARLLASENSLHEQAATTGECFEYLLKSELAPSLVNSAMLHPYTRSPIIRFFCSLVTDMDETLLFHNAVHKPIIRLIRFLFPAGREVSLLDASAENDFLDLLERICIRLHDCPELLSVFFNPAPVPVPPLQGVQRVTSPTPTDSSFNSSSSTSKRHTLLKHAECLLFSCLLCYMHRDGPVGNLARSGLLQLFTVAFVSTRLSEVSHDQYANKQRDAPLLFAEWLLDSDFSEIVGASLAAMYGLLDQGHHNIKLSSLSGGHQSWQIDEAHDKAIDSDKMENAESLSTFCAIFEFVEECVAICRQTEGMDREKCLIAGMLIDSLIKSINTLWTSSVFYVSMLESSVQDGTVTTIIYHLYCICQRSKAGAYVISAVLANLMQDGTSFVGPTEHQPSEDRKLSHRKSQSLLLMESSRPLSTFCDSPNLTGAARFTLGDLLTYALRDTNETEDGQKVRRSAVTLMALLATKFPLPFLNLFEPSNTGRAPHFLSLSLHVPSTDLNEDMFLYPGSLQHDTPILDHMLRQIELMDSLEDLVNRLNPTLNKGVQGSCTPADLGSAFEILAVHLGPYALENTCREVTVMRSKLLSQVLFCLCHFFTQHPSVNLYLTAVITNLLACANVCLQGWFTGNSKISAGCDVLSNLGQLVEQVEITKGQIPNFEGFLKDRRRFLSQADDLADALAENRTFASASPTISRVVRSPLFGAHSQQKRTNDPFSQHYEQTLGMLCSVRPIFRAAGESQELMVSLSNILDNYIILEHFLVEVLSMMQLRKACGLDNLIAES